jgi:predicted CXXCH cytochrome family protein
MDRKEGIEVRPGSTLWRRMARRAAGGIGFALLAVGLLGMPQAQAGIANTKHNLGSTGTKVNTFGGTGEICVFCHTPHGADTTAAVPLWNRALAAPSTYTTYNSLGTSSLDGATAPVGSVSLACLSCHDGTQAMNVMINAPGSGGYNATGAAFAGNWSGANQTGGKLSAGIITNIGTDLKNDHPIGIQYGGGPKTGPVPDPGNAYDNTMFKDSDFKATSSAVINGQAVWWVDTSVGTAGTREKTDMQLYSRTGAAILNSDGTVKTGANSTMAGAQPFVECASCHDPHTENTTFLRIDNSGSAVCLSCHTK